MAKKTTKKKKAVKAAKRSGRRSAPAPTRKPRSAASKKKESSGLKKAGTKRAQTGIKRQVSRAQRPPRSARRKAPSVVAFCCENSALKAAAAVDSRLLAKVEIVRLPCTGSVETETLLERVAQGARRVLVIACPIDNCTFLNGNKRARLRVAAARRALAEAGAAADRVQIEFLSSVDTHKLTSLLKEL